MSTQNLEERADQALRELLAQADPESGETGDAPLHLLARVQADMADHDPGADMTDPTGRPASVAQAAPPTTARASSTGSDGGHRHDAARQATDVPAPSFLRRHWQGSLLVAAGVCTLALAAPSVLPGFGGSDDSLASGPAVVDASGVAREDALAGSEAMAGDKVAEATGGGAAASAPDASSATSQAETDAAEQRLVRSGSVLVGTEDLQGARDQFVTTVLALGGRVTSESVVTEDGSDVSTTSGVAPDMGMSYPYPWYPMGPGIWLTVEVPVATYDQAIEAARDAGEVVRLQQSSYDVGTQIADVDARIAALEASLARLMALMDRADDISDVIALEQAIAQRQSELDALRAQQRDLANQTAMSQISLTLMSPQDAQDAVDPTPDQTWWESFLEGLSQFWSWLGQALLIVSPLLLAAAIIWFVRRRGRRAAKAEAESPATD